MITIKIKLSFISIILFTFFAFNVANNIGKWRQNQIFSWDACGYHNYLPALFIYQDIEKYEYYDKIDSIYKPTGNDIKRYALLSVEKNKNICNQYPIGVSIFQSISFFIAHQFANNTKIFPSDGYSSPYQHAVLINSILFVIFGLIILRNFLVLYFTEFNTMIVIAIIGFGTNLFNYTAIEPGLSHPYLFFLYASVLSLTNKWYSNARLSTSILLGICIGSCAILRPLDILIFLVPLLWVKFKSDKNEMKFDYLKRNYKYIIVIIVSTFIATLPQLIYWKYITGDWIYYSYSKVDYFEFNRFRLFHGLFGFRRGWFIYTPFAFIGFMGMYFIYFSKKYRFYFLPFFAFFIPMVYLVFSWHNWFYGWGYSCRALVQTLPLLAIPLSLIVERVLESNIFIRILSLVILFFLIALNNFQTWQYNHGILHGTSMNLKYYKSIFLKTETSEKELKILKEQEQHDWIYNW